MKVAIVCDQLVERTPTHSIIELVANLYPKSTIYTLAHKKGKVLGPLEMHPIRSSFLSNEVESIEDLRTKAFLIPKAIKTLKVPCSFDAVISISSGLAQCISKCENSKKLNIHVENIFEERASSLMAKFFSSSIKRLSLKHMKTEETIYCVNPRESLNKEVSPFVNVNDWRPTFDKKEGKSIIVNPNGFSEKEIRVLKEITSEFGHDFVLTYLPTGFSTKDFFHLEHPCSGELLPQFHQAVCYVHGMRFTFPFGAIEAILSGVPVVSIFSELNSRVLVPESTCFIKTVKDFSQALKEVKKMSISKGHDQLMRQRFSEKVFKAKLLRMLKQHEIDFSIG
jgi:hypothetical protein